MARTALRVHIFQGIKIRNDHVMHYIGCIEVLLRIQKEIHFSMVFPRVLFSWSPVLVGLSVKFSAPSQ